MRTLRIAADAEAASFAVLLGNLLTTHTQAITTLVGPLHGTAYLVAIAAGPLRWPRPPPRRAPDGAPPSRESADCSPCGGSETVPEEANLFLPAMTRKADAMDDAYGELPFPRTDIALSAMRFVQDIEDPAIFNHSMRTYLYGRWLGEQQDLQPDRDYDDELLFLGCLLHDAGLSPEGNGDQPFDIDGADLAARFLTDQGLSPERVEVVWDAIALHLHYEIAIRKRPEIALVTAGAGFDLGPEGPHTLPAGYADRIHATLPRLHAAPVLYDTIVGQALDKPHKAPPFSMPGELVRQETRAIWPTWKQLMTQSPSWNDYDGYQPNA